MFFTSKHGHCLRKRRTWTQQFFFCLNLSFTKGKKTSNIHHRKQFLFKEEGCGLAVSGVPQLHDPLCSQPSCTNSTPQDGSGSRARIFPWSKVPEGPLSSLGIPFSSCPRLPGKVRWPRAGTHTLPTRKGWRGQPRPAWPLTLEQSLLLFHAPLGY